MKKKAQINPKFILTAVGFIVGWIIGGKISPEFSVIGGAIGGFLAYRFL